MTEQEIIKADGSLMAPSSGRNEAAAAAADSPRPPQPNNDDDDNEMLSSKQLLSLLERRYLYQNPTTGAVSSTTLTAKQLCRLFSPPVSSASSSAPALAASSSGRVFTADTQLLALLEQNNHLDDNKSNSNSSNDSNLDNDPATVVVGQTTTTVATSYDPEGWKPVRSIPVLKHAACSAFYYTTTTTTTTLQNKDSSTSSGGPVTCRQLSELKLDPQKDQVYGESTGNQWTLIKALPDLQVAFEAFREQQQHPTSENTTTTTTMNASQQHQSSSQKSSSPPPPQEYDVSVMIYDDDSQGPTTAQDDNDSEIDSKKVQDELEAFLSSTDRLLVGPTTGKRLASLIGGDTTGENNNDNDSDDGDDDDDNDDEYESDGGTVYVKDPRTGNWIHQALAPPTRATKTAKKSSSSKHPKTNDTEQQSPPNKKAKTQQQQQTDGNNNNNNNKVKRKGKKAKFAAKNSKCWIYTTGLPPDTNEDEVIKFFSKVGIIDLDPETQRPKVKLYRTATDAVDETTGAKLPAGSCKGDASIGYARPESVELALQVLDEAPFRDSTGTTVVRNGGSIDNANNTTNLSYKIRVERAKFEQHGDYTQHKDKKKRISQAQRKVAKLASKQARDWDDGEFNGRLTGGIKGLRIIVLKGMFHPSELTTTGTTGQEDEEEEDALLADLEQRVRKISGEHGNVEKITVFSKNPRGVVVVKFTQPGAASDAVKAWDGRMFAFGGKRERKIQAIFWDGVEDFTVRDEEKEREEMERRHDAFGDWLESQADDELPEELRLKVEE